MSSWDRSRSIPWSRAIPVAPATATGEKEDVDLMKERVWRDLSREAANEAKELEKSKGNNNQQNQPMVSSPGGGASSESADEATQQSSPLNGSTTTKEEVNFLGYVGRPYQTSDLLRNLAFGATIGSITGMCFGFMDSIRSASSSDLLKSASRSAQGRFVFQGTYRSGMFFGAFFGAFHTIKYTTRVLADPGDAGEIGLGSVAALGVLMARREWRVSMPYAVMLVGMDGFHVFMREDGKV
eukprot:CAMPEP_0172547792 /NCGR_PEP_ID=MMETSP1067-20121228/17246_1 /TAXON_ID=265564 ORGANISM="Thalassiosira punctigera, Strain Tpunct2005C2" /NCGR_SAMPLE_ID=MMETSP1067 /ASSEMBLY_ACC=CAM_ASM_000444 /LENGTH=239 /DNA_ID=CAMNT_0013334933 /DNA_START=96 /DNA_END=815 /DNA_ORIENTATION=-